MGQVKYCKRRHYEYAGVNNMSTETNFVTFEDIVACHGETFANKWKEFSKLNESTFGSNKGYYYSDYKRYALTTAMWLDCFTSF